MLGVLFWTLAAASGGRRLPNVALLAVGSLFFLKMCLKPLTILTINPQKVNSQQNPLDYLTINFFDKTNVLKVKFFDFGLISVNVLISVTEIKNIDRNQTEIKLKSNHRELIVS